jgi:transposase
MRAVHGAKTKNDKIDAEKIARLLRSGTLPMAYVYPEHMRATRDLLRRRLYLVRQRAERSAHIAMTGDQYNLEPLEQRIDKKGNRTGIVKGGVKMVHPQF